jgi:hypothetical protein
VSDPPAPPPNGTELYGRVGIPVSIAILSAGLAGFLTGRISYEVSLVVCGVGLIGIALMVHLLGWHRFTTLHGLISAVSALLVSWIFIAYLLWPHPTPYVNPLHNEVTKWNMTRNLVAWSTQSNPQNPTCEIAIVRYPETYSEDYAGDFKEIIDAARWKFIPDHIVVDGSLRKGISVRGLYDNLPSHACAQFLDTRISNDWHTRSGGTSTNLEWAAASELSDFLKNCPSGLGCVEVTFGNEDNNR